MGGEGGGKKMTPPLFGLKIMNLLVSFLSRKCFRVPSPLGLYGAEWDERSCGLYTFLPFSLYWPFCRPP